jgi:signal transduction histidine kinase/ActR/RegA family two-component response regulator
MLRDEALAKHLLGSLEVAQHLGIWEWTPATDEMVWSDGLYEILEVPHGVTPSLDGLIATLNPADRPRFETHLSRARRERGLLAFRCQSGARRVLQVRMQRTLADDGSLRSIVGTNQDITDEALATDPTAVVAALTGAIAHEINNPLAVISAVLQMMPAGDATSDALLAVERICSIIGDLNLFARGDAGARGTVQLDQAISLAFAQMRGLETRATIISHFGQAAPVRANAGSLCRVVVELIENALDAVATTTLKEITVSTRGDGEWSLMEITDSGIDIAPAAQARVFDPFFTTKSVGRRGLGLSICRGIVDSLGGSITIHSQQGGTCVVVALPTTTLPKKKAAESSKVDGAKRGRVLICDDEVLFANALSRLLSAEHEVVVVHNGKDGLDRIAAGARFDVIVSDVTMPVMTGFELHAALLELAPEQAERMIFVTGGIHASSAELLGGVESFEKPCDVAELRDAVRRRVGTSRLS